MKCPRDGSELKLHEIDGVSVACCDVCSGIFLAKGELNKITHHIPGDLEFSTLENLDENRITDLNCPCCFNKKMIEVNFLSFSNIIIRYCKECGGMWLDGGELKEVNKEIDKLNDDTDNWRHALGVFISKLPL